ncbi:MAG TPA: DUF6786 family protein [Puia sp.]|nr:DUF6786 family protein [Puia sp.]
MNKWLVGALLLGSCTMMRPDKPGTFAYDLHFLQKRDSGLIVLRQGDAEVLVSPKYQAKVFTSTAAGEDGMSFGWIHYKAFDTADAHMNAYGGENRLWLGPEGGRFSLFFPPGAKMEFANWKTPAAFDTEPWEVNGRTDSGVSLEKEMLLTNYAGTPIQVIIDRYIRVLARPAIDSRLGLTPDTSVQAVGYTTLNDMKNTGSQAWTGATGMPCMWSLDMFNPSAATTIVVPFFTEPGDTSKPVTTDYFGEIPADRIKYLDSVLFFKADGKSRGKLGVHPMRAKTMMGSYDALNHVLTIAQFDIDRSARYLNQKWNTAEAPFSGDAVNAYNDGPLADGSQMGPFYELESVGQATLLKPNDHLVHQHEVFHFTGSEAALDKISKQLLGVSIGQIKSAFH